MSEYIVRGAKMKCSKGSNMRKINLPESHGSYVSDKPIMVETDRTDENIKYFGVCQCGPNKEQITVVLENGQTKTGFKCTPMIYKDWDNVKEDTKIDGKCALTKDSTLVCGYGGVIKFEDSGQE